MAHKTAGRVGTEGNGGNAENRHQTEADVEKEGRRGWAIRHTAKVARADEWLGNAELCQKKQGMVASRIMKRKPRHASHSARRRLAPSGRTQHLQGRVRLL
mmetsp:Transcript_15962/g.40040  ORF Transcript_15962/g.40040 Transcript_15962/m.40040 type:complete len:101 (+) Transcript_15962:650-952(+)